MTVCTAALAEKYALPYVEGTLPEFEAERFEEHYFSCPACLEHLQMIQAAQEHMRRWPIELPGAPRAPIQWPSRVWALGAVAAMLVVGLFAWRTIAPPTSRPAMAHDAQPARPLPQAQAQAHAATPAVRPSQLADLAMPAFAGASLRGDSPDSHFQAGMKAYTGHDCRDAIADLAQVPAGAEEAGAARFYLGACQMHLGNRDAASAVLRKIANAGDSPQQESALYYLAQISLLDADPVQAHRYLAQTIALRGDLLALARAQDRRVTELLANRSSQAR